MDHYKVAIVGAGASGLYTAYSLIKRGLTSDIIILEAEDRIGGRIHSIPYKDQWLEMGAEWIHGKRENPLWRFVQENGVICCVYLTLHVVKASCLFSDPHRRRQN